MATEPTNPPSAYHTPLDLSAVTTHDLWVDSRSMRIEIARPSPTTIELTVFRPKKSIVLDGCVVLMSTEPIDAYAYPVDGTEYEGSTDWLAPADKTDPETNVIASYHAIMENPMPDTTVGTASAFYSWTITITNTDPKQIYYASVHGSSNVLQYYPIGVQAYPLEGSQLEKSVGAYAGNIPSLPYAPTNPSRGMVYHDQQLNIDQFWDEARGIWIPTRSDTIVSGPFNPGTLGQVYLLGGSRLYFFNGVKWEFATPTNVQVRIPGGWAPFASSIASITVPVKPTPGSFFYNYTTQRYEYWDGVEWQFPGKTNTLVKKPDGGWAPGFIAPPNVEPEELRSPDLGQLFYNTTMQSLNVWDGTVWIKANTSQEGTPLSDKVAIGNDGSYDERARLIKILAGQMGWPVQCVELKEEQFNIAIDNAIENYRQLSDGAYRRGFVLYNLIAGQQLYFLNSAIDKSDSIVDVHQIARMGPMGIFGGTGQDIWSQAFAQQFYNFAAGGGDMVSTFLVAQYGEDLTRMFAGNLMFQWNESSRELYFTRAIHGPETVIIECTMERTEQEIFSDRWCKQFIQNWALAEVKMMLGWIRSKFSSGTPGPAGTITLNGELLIAEARQDMTELKESLLNYEYGGHVGQGNVSFLIG